MASAYEDYVEGLRKASRPSRTTVREVSLQVPNVPASTLTGPGLGPAPACPSDRRCRLPPRRAAPAVPGLDASEISTTPQARPERVAPPALPGRAGAPRPAVAQAAPRPGTRRSGS